jgi:hypothetical protein
MSLPFKIHLYVTPVVGLALRTVLPPVQKEVAPEIDTTGSAFTVAVTAVLVAAKHPVVVFLACA